MLKDKKTTIVLIFELLLNQSDRRLQFQMISRVLIDNDVIR